MKCIVKGCENHKNEGGFEDGMCLPCYLFITTGEGVYSQAYRNAKPAELTDKEIAKYVKEWELKELKENSASTNYVQELAFIDGLTWLLRKAQEK